MAADGGGNGQPGSGVWGRLAGKSDIVCPKKGVVEVGLAGFGKQLMPPALGGGRWLSGNKGGWRADPSVKDRMGANGGGGRSENGRVVWWEGWRSVLGEGQDRLGSREVGGDGGKACRDLYCQWIPKAQASHADGECGLGPLVRGEGGTYAIGEGSTESG